MEGNEETRASEDGTGADSLETTFEKCSDVNDVIVTQSIA